MDPRLAEIYGTNQESVESVAADELAEKLAAADDMNVDGLSDDEAEALAQEILEAAASEEAPEEQQQYEDADEESLEGEDTEKVAEAQADYLGRVMAHAFTQELRGIEKEAGAKWDATRGAVGKFLSSSRKGGKAAFGKVKEVAGKAKDVATGKQAREGFKNMSYHAAEGNKADNLPNAMRHRIGLDKAKKETAKGVAKTVGAYGSVGTAAGYAYHKKKHSSAAEGSAFDTLAQQRAFEILQANGIDVSGEQQQYEEDVEKTSAAEDTKYDLLAQAVDSRAWEMLNQAGYTRAEEE